MRVLAIDGPGGSGKSTVARACAKALGLEYLDTGAMYRAVAWAAINQGIDLTDEQAVVELAQSLALTVAEKVLVDGEDVTKLIRSEEITAKVAPVAANQKVRAELVRRQREWTYRREGGVLEGRDIGTVVFPQAPLKVFLTASSGARAARRASEAGGSEEEIAEALTQRDTTDLTRFPVADDAVTIDSSNLSIDQVVAKIVELWGNRTGERPVSVPVVSAAQQRSTENATKVSSSKTTPSVERTPVVPVLQVKKSEAVMAIIEEVEAETTEVVEETSTAINTSQRDGRRNAGVDAGVSVVGTRRNSLLSAVTTNEKIALVPVGKLTNGARITYKSLWWFLQPIVRLYWRINIEGARNVPKRGAVIFAPIHRSNVDAIVVAVAIRRQIRFLAKHSLWKGPLANILSFFGIVPVHRGTPDRDALRRCEEILTLGDALVVFPEGGRRDGPLVGELFDGVAFLAHRLNVPVIPVGIGGSDRSMPKGAKWVHPAHISVVFGEPIYPSESGTKTGRTAKKKFTMELQSALQEIYDRSKVLSGS